MSSEQQQTVFDRVRPILSEMFGVGEDTITRESSFIDDLGADSLDRVEMAFIADDVFAVDLSDEELETMTTVGGLVDAIERKTGTTS